MKAKLLSTHGNKRITTMVCKCFCICWDVRAHTHSDRKEPIHNSCFCKWLESVKNTLWNTSAAFHRMSGLRPWKEIEDFSFPAFHFSFCVYTLAQLGHRNSFILIPVSTFVLVGFSALIASFVRLNRFVVLGTKVEIFKANGGLTTQLPLKLISQWVIGFRPRLF